MEGKELWEVRDFKYFGSLIASTKSDIKERKNQGQGLEGAERREEDLEI